MDYFFCLSPEHPIGAPTRECLFGHVRQVQLAGAYGFRGVTAGQHVSTSGMQWFPPYQLLSFLAPFCPEMTLGTAVAVQPFMHPVLMAEAAATLDAITDGRSILGLGAGWNRHEFQSLGLTRKGGLDRLKEAISLIQHLWTDSSLTWNGSFYSFEDVTLALRPVTQSGPPIWIGASTEKTVRALAGTGDALVYSGHLSLPDLQHLQRSYLEERESLGLAAPTDTPVHRSVFVAQDTDTALRTALPYVEASYRQYGNAGLFRDVIARNGAAPDDLTNAVDERLIVGGPGEVAASLTKLARSLKITKLIVRMQWLGMPSSLVEESLRRFGEEVMPALDSALASSESASG